MSPLSGGNAPFSPRCRGAMGWQDGPATLLQGCNELVDGQATPLQGCNDLAGRSDDPITGVQ